MTRRYRSFSRRWRNGHRRAEPWAKLRRDHGNDVEDHGPRVVLASAVLVALVEGGDDLEPLDGLLLALSRKRLHVARGIDQWPAGASLFVVEVDSLDQLSNGVGAHAAFEVVTEAVGHFTPQELVFDDLAREQFLELVPSPVENVDLHLVLLAGGMASSLSNER